jgi:sigma-B regulation protein RsbU (phosphoserine phosphatase)
MMIGVLELDARRLTYVNAGHNPALLYRGGAVERLEATSPPLGALEGLEFPAREVMLAPGDTLVLYTDGLSERRNRHHHFYDEAGIEAAIKRDGHVSADALVRALVRDNETFAEGVPPDDDTAIVVIRATERPAG